MARYCDEEWRTAVRSTTPVSVRDLDDLQVCLRTPVGKKEIASFPEEFARRLPKCPEREKRGAVGIGQWHVDPKAYVDSAQVWNVGPEGAVLANGPRTAALPVCGPELATELNDGNGRTYGTGSTVRKDQRLHMFTHTKHSVLLTHTDGGGNKYIAVT